MLTQIFDDTRIVTSPVLLADIRMTPEELTRRHAIKWQFGNDDLDTFRHATVRAGVQGPPFELLSYANDPNESLLVLGRMGAVSDADLTLLVDALGASPDQVMGRRLSESSVVQRVPRSATQDAPDQGRTVFAGRVRRESRTLAGRVTFGSALVLAGLAVAGFWAETWEVPGLLALVLGAFAVALPRMVGRWHLGGAPPTVEGEFERRLAGEPTQAPDPESARAKGSGVG